MFDIKPLKTEIKFYGIAKTIEILNNRLETCDENDIDNIVCNIIKLEEQFNKYDNKPKVFIKGSDSNE